VLKQSCISPPAQPHCGLLDVAPYKRTVLIGWHEEARLQACKKQVSRPEKHTASRAALDVKRQLCFSMLPRRQRVQAEPVFALQHGHTVVASGHLTQYTNCPHEPALTVCCPKTNLWCGHYTAAVPPRASPSGSLRVWQAGVQHHAAAASATLRRQPQLC
jgi:hypothetical protein